MMGMLIKITLHLKLDSPTRLFSLGNPAYNLAIRICFTQGNFIYTCFHNLAKESVLPKVILYIHAFITLL